jgi:hypothetical protein
MCPRSLSIYCALALLALACRRDDGHPSSTRPLDTTAPGVAGPSVVSPAAPPSVAPPPPAPVDGGKLRTEDERNTIAIFRAAAPSTVFVTQLRILIDQFQRTAPRCPRTLVQASLGMTQEPS